MILSNINQSRRVFIRDIITTFMDTKLCFSELRNIYKQLAISIEELNRKQLGKPIRSIDGECTIPFGLTVKLPKEEYDLLIVNEAKLIDILANRIEYHYCNDPTSGFNETMKKIDELPSYLYIDIDYGCTVDILFTNNDMKTINQFLYEEKLLEATDMDTHNTSFVLYEQK